MSNKKFLRAIAFVCILPIIAFARPIRAAAPTTDATAMTATVVTNTSFIEIPSINLSVPLVVAQFTGTTWDFSKLNAQAGFLEGLPMPGQGSNVVIGAHSALGNQIPGPFYNLDHVKVKDQIIVVMSGVKYTYIVVQTWYVLPTDISPISPTKIETLTLLTCAGYNQHIYTTRLIVRATLIS